MNPDGSIQLSGAQQLMMAISVFLPLLIAMINKVTWPSEVKAIVAFVVCMFVGAVFLYFDGRFNLQNVGMTLGACFIVAAVFYARFWNPMGTAPTIERNINP